MKNLLITISVFISVSVHATDYYFSTTDGNDANTSTQAQNQATPWKTLSKLNTFFSNLLPGDHIYFKRGDVFYGTFTASVSGASGNPIVFDAYGVGANPIWTGLDDATSWTSLGSNIYRSAAVGTGQSTAMVVTVNDISYPMGKWPNGITSTGWRTISSHSGSSPTITITDGTTIPGSPSLIGATLVARSNQYTIQKGTITAQTSTTLTYTQNSGETVTVTNGNGYFVQNFQGSLDAQNEWYWDGTNKQLYLYSATTPSNVKVSTVTSIAILTSKSYFTFNNIVFQGSISDAISADGVTGLVFNGCTISQAGNSGIWANTVTGLSFLYGYILNCNNFGMYVGSTSSTGIVVTGSTIQNSGLYAGMTSQNSHTAIESADGALLYGSLTFTSNQVKSSGYAALHFKGSNVLIQNNLFDTACITKDEGAIVYSFVGQGGDTTYSNQIIDGNIILNGLGALAGKSSSTGDAKGIYMDIGVHNMHITNNSIAHCANFGILLQDNGKDTIRGNTIYDCDKASFAMWSDALGDNRTHSTRFAKNKCVMKQNNAGFGNIYFDNDQSSQINWGTSDSNIVATPLNSDVNLFYTATAGAFNHRTLLQWQSATGNDSHSTGSPKFITSTDSIRFVYNATNSAVEVPLGAKWIDMSNTLYSGFITLGPYSSAVLLYAAELDILPLTPTQLQYNFPGQLRFSLVNPAKDYLTMNIPVHSKQTMEFNLYDVVGRQLIKKKISLVSGDNVVKIDVERIQAGMYIAGLENRFGYFGYHKVIIIK